MAGDEKMIAAWPLPVTDAPDDAPFYQAGVRGELAMQACAECGRLRFPPRCMCPACRSMKVEWKKMSGRGRIWSFVVPHPPLLPVFNEQAPYNVIVVELDDDPAIRLVGNLVTGPDDPLDAVDPATIRIGEAVEAVFVPMADDVSLIRWKRVAV
jgi:uncharacterized OB-fold protein